MQTFSSGFFFSELFLLILYQKRQIINVVLSYSDPCWGTLILISILCALTFILVTFEMCPWLRYPNWNIIHACLVCCFLTVRVNRLMSAYMFSMCIFHSSEINDVLLSFAQFSSEVMQIEFSSFMNGKGLENFQIYYFLINKVKFQKMFYLNF